MCRPASHTFFTLEPLACILTEDSDRQRGTENRLFFRRTAHASSHSRTLIQNSNSLPSPKVSLTELNLDNNSIVSLPSQLGLILKLKTLSLANNQIQVSSSSAIPFSDKNPQPIPAAIFSDTLLIDLNMQGNRLTQTRLNDFEGFYDFWRGGGG